MFEVISGKLEKAIKLVVYGPEGIGKSSLVAMLPRAIFIDTEGSTTEMDVRRMPRPTSWEMLKQQVAWVKQQGPVSFGSLIIDTFDWAEMLATSSVCSANGKESVEDFGYGKGYVYVADEIGKFLNFLSDVVDSGIHVALVAHSQIVKFEQPDEMGSYDRYQLKLGQKTGSRTGPLVKEWADVVLFVNYKTFSVAADKEGKKHKAQGGSRVVYATHHPAWDAKNRHGLPDEFPLDFSHIAHIFNRGVSSPAPEVPAVPVTPVTAVTPPPAPAVDTSSQSAPAPAPTPPATVPAPAVDPINADIPKPLLDLMVAHQVKEDEIQLVVSKKGYYPLDTPIQNYDETFISGVLVGAWPKVFEMIQELRKDLPF